MNISLSLISHALYAHHLYHVNVQNSLLNLADARLGLPTGCGGRSDESRKDHTGCANSASGELRAGSEEDNGPERPTDHSNISAACPDLSQTLVVVDAADLDATQPLPPHVLCTGGDANLIEALRASPGEVVVLDGTITAEQAFDEVLALMRRYRALEHSLLELLLTGCDPDVAMDACARFFQCPTFLFDDALRVVAIGSTYQHDPHDRYWQETTTTGYLSEQMMMAMRDAGLLHTLETSREAVLVDLPGIPRRLVANVFQQGHRIASLCVDEASPGHAPSILQAGLIEYLAQFIGAYVGANRILFGNKPLSFTNMIQRVIRNEDVGASDMRAFLSRRGWHEHDQYCVAVMTTPDEARKVGISRFSLQTAAALFSDAALVEEGDRLVAVIHRAHRSPLDWEPGEAFRARIDRLGVRCAFSMPFCGFTLLRSAYRMACWTLEHCVPDGKAQLNLALFRNHVFDYVAEHLGPEDSLRCICHPGVLELSAHDRAHGSDLLRSLTVYLDTGSNVSRAAKRLFIHRNTLVYRLKQAWGILGIREHDTIDRAHILLSCKIAERLPDRLSADELAGATLSRHNE